MFSPFKAASRSFFLRASSWRKPRSGAWRRLARHPANELRRSLGCSKGRKDGEKTWKDYVIFATQVEARIGKQLGIQGKLWSIAVGELSGLKRFRAKFQRDGSPIQYLGM